MSGDRQALRALIEAELRAPVPSAAGALAARLGGAAGVRAVLFYGSGLWQAPAADTVFDFYLLVDRYLAYDPRRVHALFGWLLPPNVYFLNAHAPPGKCAVMRLDQFAAAAAGRAWNSQVWARFAQPCRLPWVRDQASREAVVEALADAVNTFHAQTLPLLPATRRTPREIWVRGLRQTYGNEWRSESGARAEAIFAASRGAFEARSRLVVPHCRPAQRITTRGMRRGVSKAVYFLQLVKAVFTFEGGVDYALWKIERQSGVVLKASDFQRRHPLLAAWPLVWKAWRAGALR